MSYLELWQPYCNQEVISLETEANKHSMAETGTKRTWVLSDMILLLNEPRLLNI